MPNQRPSVIIGTFLIPALGALTHQSGCCPGIRHYFCRPSTPSRLHFLPSSPTTGSHFTRLDIRTFHLPACTLYRQLLDCSRHPLAPRTLFRPCDPRYLDLHVPNCPEQKASERQKHRFIHPAWRFRRSIESIGTLYNVNELFHSQSHPNPTRPLRSQRKDRGLCGELQGRVVIDSRRRCASHQASQEHRR